MLEVKALSTYYGWQEGQWPQQNWAGGSRRAPPPAQHGSQDESGKVPPALGHECCASLLAGPQGQLGRGPSLSVRIRGHAVRVSMGP